MTTTAMKRAGLLIAHLETLHQIRDVRQLLLLQLSMRERQDQVALFKRQEGEVTLSLIGAQVSPPAQELSHRAGTVAAAALLGQLQQISGITGDDVAFSGGQIAGMVDAETHRIEESEGLARLDAALLSLVGKLELQQEQAAQEPGQPGAADPSRASQATAPEETEASAQLVESATAQNTEAEEEGQSQRQDPDLISGLSSVRVSRRRG